MADELRLDGKVALITGAAGEIGTATMQLFAARGARIVAVDRNEAQLQRAVAALPADARALAVTADVTREDDVAAYVRRAVETAGTIDVFFNNAGSIVTTASIAGLIGSPHIAVYSASKHAVIGLTKSVAMECSTTRVRVNCVCPGLIQSRMLSAIFEGRNPNARADSEKVLARIPAHRLGLPAEVAQTVAFLASDAASYISGSAYTVDGGRTAG